MSPSERFVFPYRLYEETPQQPKTQLELFHQKEVLWEGTVSE